MAILDEYGKYQGAIHRLEQDMHPGEQEQAEAA